MKYCAGPRFSYTSRSLLGVLVMLCGSTILSAAENSPQQFDAHSVSHCTPYVNTEWSNATATVLADPSNWIDKISAAPEGAEVLLADGVYDLKSYAVVLERSMTLRSASGNREAVIVKGQGYDVNAEALMIMADDVHIADLTVKNIRDHAISIKEGFARSVIYNVELQDVGTQHIKGNRSGPDGVIACSKMGYSTEVAPGDYNGAIDLHAAVGWNIRDNYIYNIYGDGSGCVVDEDCGTYYPGGGPAILLWQDSRNNTIERNRILGSFRGISLGLDTPYNGGVVRDNVIYMKTAGKPGVNGLIESDAGISLLGANDVLVEGNVVMLAGSYPGAIELQDASGIVVKNNILSAPVWNRRNSQYNSCDAASDEDCDAPGYRNVVAGVQLPEAVVVTDNELSDTIPGLPEPELEKVDLAAVDSLADADHPVPPDADTSASVDSLSESEHRLHALLEEIKEATRAARMERLLGVEERLRMKEERLRYIETRLMSGVSAFTDPLVVGRIRNIEALLNQLEQ